MRRAVVKTEERELKLVQVDFESHLTTYPTGARISLNFIVNLAVITSRRDE